MAGRPPEPVRPQPVVSEPAVSKPVVSEPVVSEPVLPEPAETPLAEPTANEPVAAEATATQPSGDATPAPDLARSEEHKSELQLLIRYSYPLLFLKQKTKTPLNI